MHIDGALVDIDVAAPNAVEQLLTAEHPARMFQKKLQEPVFRRAEIDRTPRTGDAALLAIELDVAIAEHGGEPLGAGAPQQTFHPRQQFRHRERLDDVIVGAGCKAPDPLAFLAARGQHDDRQLLGLGARPQAAAQLDPRQARQHPVEHDQVGNALLQSGVGIVAASHRLNVVAFGIEVVA